MSRSTGAFVYTGSGKKQSEHADAAQKKCKKQACAIQWCLARNNHIESRCNAFIQDWKDCCERARTHETIKAEVAESLKKGDKEKGKEQQ